MPSMQTVMAHPLHLSLTHGWEINGRLCEEKMVREERQASLGSLNGKKGVTNVILQIDHAPEVFCG